MRLFIQSVGIRLFTASLSLVLLPAPASAMIDSLWNYVKQYQFGVDYSNSYDRVNVTYETASAGAPASSCSAVAGDGSRQRCSIDMQGGGASGYGFFLQQAFKRQGKFYFKPDVGFGLRSLNGAATERDIATSKASGLPLNGMNFSLLAGVVKPYIQLGLTPTRPWPDLLISLGPSLQVAIGKVEVNGQSEQVAMATRSGIIGGFFELELVFWRFGDGAFSAFSSSDYSGGTGGTKFYPKSVDGMDNFRADFSRSISGGLFGFGLKLMLDWP